MAAIESDVGKGPGAGLTKREELGAVTIARSGETSATSAAALAKAEVEARFVVAINRPRDMDDVRVRLLKECDRPGFAAVARYSVPRAGRRIEGPSIRFAEAVARLMGNLDIRQPVIFEDDEKRIMRVTVTDLETNATYSLDIAVTKTLERRELRRDQEALDTRVNSSGQMVYIVRATDEDLAQKQAASLSKAIRNLVLRLAPGDIVEECMNAVVATQNRADRADPDAARKRLIDSFVVLGAKPAQLREYVGHEFDALNENELVELRGLYAAIRDGQITMAQAIEERRADPAATPPAPGKPATRTAGVKDALNRARKSAVKEATASDASGERLDYDPSAGEAPPNDVPA